MLHMDFYDSNESDRTFYRSPKEMLHGLSPERPLTALRRPAIMALRTTPGGAYDFSEIRLHRDTVHGAALFRAVSRRQSRRLRFCRILELDRQGSRRRASRRGRCGGRHFRLQRRRGAVPHRPCPENGLQGLSAAFSGRRYGDRGKVRHGPLQRSGGGRKGPLPL